MGNNLLALLLWWADKNSYWGKWGIGGIFLRPKELPDFHETREFQFLFAFHSPHGFAKVNSASTKFLCFRPKGLLGFHGFQGFRFRSAC
jgi:hypothetical protein